MHLPYAVHRSRTPGGLLIVALRRVRGVTSTSRRRHERRLPLIPDRGLDPAHDSLWVPRLAAEVGVLDSSVGNLAPTMNSSTRSFKLVLAVSF